MKRKINAWLKTAFHFITVLFFRIGIGIALLVFLDCTALLPRDIVSRKDYVNSLMIIKFAKYVFDKSVNHNSN